MKDPFSIPETAIEEIQQRIRVLRSKAERARDESAEAQKRAVQSDWDAKNYDRIASQYEHLIVD